MASGENAVHALAIQTVAKALLSRLKREVSPNNGSGR
jgi:hypothetical protein